MEDVSYDYPHGEGVRDLDLTIDPGDIVALIGLNGAGRTTLMRLLLSMLRPRRGEVRLWGTAIPQLPHLAWRGMGALIERPAAYPELSVRENLHLARLLRGAEPGVVDQAIETWDLGQVADRRARRLSLGTRQRLGLAIALQHDPSLTVLDEPSGGLDPASVILLRDHLRERAADGAGILVSSHHLDEVARIADRVVLMNRGRLIGELDPRGLDLERVFFERIRADDAHRAGAAR